MRAEINKETGAINIEVTTITFMGRTYVAYEDWESLINQMDTLVARALEVQRQIKWRNARKGKHNEGLL